MHLTKRHMVCGIRMEGFGVLLVCGFCGDSHRFYCGDGMSMGIEILSPGQPCQHLGARAATNLLLRIWMERRLTSTGQTDGRTDRQTDTDRYTNNTPHTMWAARTSNGELQSPSPAPLSRWTRPVTAPAAVYDTTRPIRRSRGVSLRTTTQ